MDYSHWRGKPKRACFNCRKCFKDRTYHQLAVQTKTCPHCGGELHNMGTHFKAPRRSDDKAWEAIEMLYEAGVRYTVFDWHYHAYPEFYKRKRKTGETVEEHILRGVLGDIGIALPRAEEATADSIQPPKAKKKPWRDPHKTQWRGPRPTHPREVPAFLKWWKEQNLDRIAIAVEACEKLGYQPPDGFVGELYLEKMKEQFDLD
jgi:hypothetical protein